MGGHEGDGVPQGGAARQSQHVSVYAPVVDSAPRSTATAFLFDLDGTLVDSIGGVVEALNAVMKTLGRRRITRAEAIRFSGDGSDALVARALAATGVAAAPDALPDLVQRYARVRHARGDQAATLFPGVMDALALLAAQQCPMAICTNRPFRNAAALANRFGLDRYMAEIVGGDSVGARKPDPAPLREALRRLGVPPQRAIFVGDAAEDVEAGRAAGVRVMLTSYGYAKTEADRNGAVAILDDLRALDGALSVKSKPARAQRAKAPDLAKAAARGRDAARAAARSAAAQMRAAVKRAIRKGLRVG